MNKTISNYYRKKCVLLSTLLVLILPVNNANSAQYVPPGFDAMALASDIGILLGYAELCNFPNNSKFKQMAKAAITRRQWTGGDAQKVWLQLDKSRLHAKQNPDMQQPALRKYVCSKELSLYNESYVWKPGWVFGQ